MQSYLYTTVAPLRFEADVYDCEVLGELPKALEGSFYRCGADSRIRPWRRHRLNGDGLMAAFHFWTARPTFRAM